jgi:hypothetical protein
MYMEMLQGTPCVTISNRQKRHFFFSLFCKIREEEDARGFAWGISYQWEGEGSGQRCRRVNMVQILCTCECKWKKDTISRMGYGKVKKNDRGGEFNYDIFDIF